MKKKALKIMSLMMMAVLVGSIGFAAPKKTKVVWWTHQRHDMDYMQEKVAEFNRTNKEGIEIEYVIQTENYSQNLELAFQSVQAPDCIFRRKLDSDSGRKWTPNPGQTGH